MTTMNNQTTHRNAEGLFFRLTDKIMHFLVEKQDRQGAWGSPEKIGWREAAALRDAATEVL